MTFPPPGPQADERPFTSPGRADALANTQGLPGQQAHAAVVLADRYELIARIGDGGHGTVWRAHDRLLRRHVAVKEVILPPNIPQAERDQLCQRTLREAQAAASLSHASVVRVFDVITERGLPWIVMELLQARSLADIIASDGPMPPRVVAKIGLALTGALEAAHEAGILHRDIKPGNVLISSDGRCVLSDFGAAAAGTSGTGHTAPGMVLGSAHYIAPERAIGGAAEPASDLFSLGVTLYAALEGRPPFERGDTTATMHAVVHDPPEAPRHAGPLAPVLAGLLEKDPSRRFTISHTRNTLTALLAGPLAGEGAPSVLPTSGGPISGIPAPTAGYPAGQVSGPPTSPFVAPPGQVGAFPPPPMAPPQFGTTIPAKKSAPKSSVLLAGGIGVVVLALLVTLGVVFFGGEPEKDPDTTVTGQEEEDTGPDFEVVSYEDPDGRFTVDVPKGWEPVPTGTYVDFFDPNNSDIRLRLNVTSEGDPKSVLEAGERYLDKGNGGMEKNSVERISLEPATMADAEGYELQYTGVRTEGKQDRQAVWLIIEVDGTDYQVYLSTSADTYKDSLPIYEHAVKTFTLTG